ncbi:MAG: hypothetical protein PHD01_06715 [Geobacteraceae bacterium]|nr:hypothetical protein [Geobacteraceae bacterium]
MVKYPHAPEAVTTGNRINVTIVHKLLGIKIFARHQVAVGAERIFVVPNLFPERKNFRVVPDIPYPLLFQAPNTLRMKKS